MKPLRTVVTCSINASLRVIGTMPTCILSNPYSATLSGFGGSGAWTFTPDPAQILPTGLVESFGAGTYTVSGTTSVPGPVHVFGILTDTDRESVPYSYTFLVQPLPLAVAGTAPAGRVGSAYTYTFVGSGGISPYTWSYTGTLPLGLSLDPSTGVLSGTPTTAGSYSFTVIATDSASVTASDPQTVSIAYATLALTGAFTDIYDNGDAGSTAGSLAIAGGQTPYITPALQSGALPTGLSLSVSGSTLVLTGTTSAYGSFTFVPQVSSTDGQTAVGPSQTIIVGDPLWSSVVFALHFDGSGSTFVDQKGGTWNSVNAATQSSVWSKFGGKSLRTEAINGACVQSSSTSLYEVGSNDFTFDGWVNVVSLPASGQFAFPASKDNGNSTQLLAIDGTSGKLYVGLVDGSSNFYGVFALASTATSTAIHFEATRHGNTLYLFLNGVLQGTAALPPGMTVFATTNKFTFGSQGPATFSFYDGYSDDPRLVIGAYRHTANFTPSTRAFPNGGV